MNKLVPVTAIGLALGAMGCQAQAQVPPAQAPQGAAMAAPPPPPPPGPGPGPGMMGMGHHPDVHGWPGGEHEGCEACAHEHHPEGGPMARGEHHDGGWRHEGPGEHPGMMGPGGMGPGGMGPGGGEEGMRQLAALGVHFYPPPVLLRRAQKVGLTADQVTKIRQEVLSTEARSVDLRAKMEHARVEVTRLLAADKVDEHAVDAQVDEAAKAEAEMHKLHLGTMLHVRALLTPEQRQKLDERKPGKERPKAGPGAAGQTGPADDDDDDDDDDADG